MNIFSDSTAFEENTFNAIDTAAYFRHEETQTFMPFVLLKNGERTFFRNLAVEGNPIPFATEIIKNEKEDFDQYAICFEGRYSATGKENRTDAIVVLSFQTNLEKGIEIVQPFNSKEVNGVFEFTGQPIVLGQPDAILIRELIDTSPMGRPFNGVISTINEANESLVNQTFAITHHSISLIKQEIKVSALETLAKKENFSGAFHILVNSNVLSNNNPDFHRFVLKLLLSELENREELKNWERKTGRKVEVDLKLGDEVISVENKLSSSNQTDDIDRYDPSKFDFSKFSDSQLEDRYKELCFIPNASRNPDVLFEFSLVLEEYKKRGLSEPDLNSNPKFDLEDEKQVNEAYEFIYKMLENEQPNKVICEQLEKAGIEKEIALEMIQNGRDELNNSLSDARRNDLLIGILSIVAGAGLTFSGLGRIFYGAIIFGIYKVVKGFTKKY